MRRMDRTDQRHPGCGTEIHFTVRHLSKIGFIFSTRPRSLALLPHKRKEVKTKRREWGRNWKWTSVCERRLCKHILSHIISCNWLGIRSSVLFSISQQIYETAEPVWAIIIFIFHFNHTSNCKLEAKTSREEFPYLLSLPIAGGDHLLLVIALYKSLCTICMSYFLIRNIHRG